MKMKSLILCVICLLMAVGCAPKQTAVGQSGKPSDRPTFSYTHYASGGTAETYEAVILFEEYNSTFTAYQVAFSSCTCRDSRSNFLSVAYVEILNTRGSGEDATIRSITFGGNRGLWGDSNPNYYIPAYTESYYDEHFVQKLVKLRKKDFDAWSGYGTQVEGIEVDAVTGATVSTSNITSMLRSLMAYHAAHYYAPASTETPSL